MDNNSFCVILAGGKGRRLWPYSRDKQPKQFIDFFGCGKTQLQATYDRFASIVPHENILVCTNREYYHLVREQLVDLPEANILPEPVNRNTAPSVAWAVTCIARRNATANVVVTPSDLFVMNEQAFAENITKGLEFVAANDDILTMGVKPTRPEPGYGYIQMGDSVGVDNVFRVHSFTEKPERDFAKVFMESGEFFWNTGLFLGSAHCFTTTLERLFHDVQGRMENFADVESCYDGRKAFDDLYSSYPNLSIDYGILEHSDNVCVMRCDFGWADLGTWHSIYECMNQASDDNVVIDSDVILDDSSDNVIKLPKGKLGVINGLRGYIVAEKDGVLLICKKSDSSSLIRKYVNEVQMKYGEKYI